MIFKAVSILVYLPVISGTLVLLINKAKFLKRASLFTFLVSLLYSVYLFINPALVNYSYVFGEYTLLLNSNLLSRVVMIFINIFTLIICIYSLSSESLKKNRLFFAYLAYLAAFSNLVCMAGDFITFIFAWGVNLALLYAMLSIGSSRDADKALSIVGFADFAFILGASFYIYLSGSSLMPSHSGIALQGFLPWLTFVLMLSAALAKAGCGPFHSWIPQASENSNMAVMAILPASLDKLLGIYLLGRICTDLFILNNAALAILMILGSITILFAVIMALAQHDLRKLLSYHAISQVGYMVLGFGTGVGIGIAGGLFHMINHALYKSGLFLSGGLAGENKKTFELDKLGGLAAYMPLVFLCALVFSLSISGVPPFNGFVSKWMIYQGVLTGFTVAGPALKIVFLISLIAAMFGSALTLASFVKFIHSVFLGQKSCDNQVKNRVIPPVSFSAKLSLASLACFCIILGLFGSQFVKYFISPYLNEGVVFLGYWNGVLAFILITAGLLIGLGLLRMDKRKVLRTDEMFIGGESLSSSFSPNFPGTEFYKTVEEVPLFKKIYLVLNKESLDFYNIVNAVINFISRVVFFTIDRFINFLTYAVGYIILGLSYIFRILHSGILDFYLAWGLAGLIILFIILMGLK